jgi:hypothetical protein
VNRSTITLSLILLGTLLYGGSGKGYKIYYGTASGDYDTFVDVGYVFTYKLTGLANGTYYFAAIFYDGNGGESEYSNEVSDTVTTGSITLAWDASSSDVNSNRSRIRK